MHVEIATDGVRIGDAGNLRALDVRCEPGVDLAAALGSFGEVTDDGQHVWLLIDELRTRAGASVAAVELDDWRDGFDAMVTFARSKGWTSVDGRRVRAHVEPA